MFLVGIVEFLTTMLDCSGGILVPNISLYICCELEYGWCQLYEAFPSPIFVQSLCAAAPCPQLQGPQDRGMSAAM